MNRILRPIPRWLALFLYGITLAGFAAGQDQSPWEDTIRKFESADKRDIPQQGAILFLGSSSLRLWDLGKYFPGRQTVNRKIEEFSRCDSCLEYLDVDGRMIGSDGRPRPELLAEDGLHLSPEGYQLWSEAIIPVLDSGEGSDCCGTNAK